MTKSESSLLLLKIREIGIVTGEAPPLPVIVAEAATLLSLPVDPGAGE